MCRLRDAAFSYFVVDAEATITPFRVPFISLVNALVSRAQRQERNSDYVLKKLKKIPRFLKDVINSAMLFNRRAMDYTNKM